MSAETTTDVDEAAPVADEKHPGSRVAERAPGPGPTTFGVKDGSGRTWIRPLLVIAALALILRLVMVLVVHPTCEFDTEKWARGGVTAADFGNINSDPDGCFNVEGDALYMFLQGRMLADGHGYVSPIYMAITGKVTPGAGKPPAWPTTIGAMNVVGLKSPTDVRVLAAILGAAAVLLIGHTAGRFAGRRAAIIAAVIAALYPMLWINDWKMLNDGPMILATTAVVYAAYSFWARPRPRSAVLLGAAIAAAALTRSEALQLLVLMVIPLCWFLRRFTPSARLRLMAVIWLTFLAFWLPWLSFNVARFHETTVAAGGSIGSVSMNSACDAAWYGPNTGYLDFKCFDERLHTDRLVEPTGPPIDQSDESDLDASYREQANAYIKANLPRAPAVVAARVGRLWDVYKPQQNLGFNINLEERGRFDSTAGLYSYFALMPWVIAGMVILYRRRITIVPFVAIATVVSISAAIAFGITRYRVPFDAVSCILAAVAIDAFAGRYLGAGRRSIPDDLRSLRIRPPAWSAGRWALTVVPVLLVVGVVVWSAGVEPPAKASPSTPSAAPGGATAYANEQTRAACTVISNNNLGDRTLYDRLGVEDMEPVLAAFAKVEATGPPQVASDAHDIRVRFEMARDAGFAKGHILDALSQADRAVVATAGLRFITFAQNTCR